MYFWVNQLREKGVVIPGHHIVRREGAPGRFEMSEQIDRETRRTVRVARLFAIPPAVGELLPPLVDAALIYARGEIWTLTGFERGSDSLMQPAYLQSWRMRPFSWQELRELAVEHIAAGLDLSRTASS
ncbi:MAG: hypothetical protein C0423_01910 [Methylibium sp.]|nr:hypothetical protein [Methylibium sp.]